MHPLLLLIVVPVAVAAVLAYYAALLQLACRICRVQKPGFLKAVGVFVAAMFFFIPIGAVLGGILLVAGGPSGEPPVALELGLQLLSIPLQMLVAAGVYGGFLHTSYARGLLVCLTQFGIALVIGLVLLVILLGISLLLTGGSGLSA